MDNLDMIPILKKAQATVDTGTATDSYRPERWYPDTSVRIGCRVAEKGMSVYEWSGRC